MSSVGRVHGCLRLQGRWVGKLAELDKHLRRRDSQEDRISSDRNCISCLILELLLQASLDLRKTRVAMLKMEALSELLSGKCFHFVCCCVEKASDLQPGTPCSFGETQM